MPRFGGFLAILRDFVRDARGSIVPLVGVGFVVGSGFAAVGVDYVRSTAHRQSLQLAADAAALAAATRLPSQERATAAALLYVEKNMPAAEFGSVLAKRDIEFGVWDDKRMAFVPGGDGAAGGSAVRVTARLSVVNGNPVTTLLGGVIGVDYFEAAASAVAGRGGAPCVLTLDPMESTSMRVRSKASLEAHGCGVQVNSTAKNALRVDGNALIASAGNCVGGTVSVSGSSSLTPEPREMCPGQPDPFAGLVLPSYGSCTESDAEYAGDTAHLSPGVYCGGLKIEEGSDITFEPGLYVMKDGPLTVDSDSRLGGEGVTILLTGDDSYLDFDGGSEIDLSAPKSGDLQGMLMIQDPAYRHDHFWNGESTANLVGVVYLPTGALTADSSNQVTPYKACTVLITEDLQISNKSSISIDISGADCRDVLPGPYSSGVVLYR